LVASRSEDPRTVLFGQDAGESLPVFNGKQWCGFYWTEGSRGLGWAVDAVPTLKGGSSIGIPSPPGIWDPLTGSVITPDIRDAERFQGFDSDWTAAAVEANSVRRGHRWKLVGNAVSVPVAAWLGERLRNPKGELPPAEIRQRGIAWPKAAWGSKGRVFSVPVSTWPVNIPSTPLQDFLRHPATPLSARAAGGFHSRASVSCLNFEVGFLDDVRRHAERMTRRAVA
jgi:DNA (cytosine-5)-methyltransferase 1